MTRTEPAESRYTRVGCHLCDVVKGVLDVRDGAAVAALAAELPQPDGLFNCAGYVHEGSVLACDEAAWDFSFDLNVKGAYRLVRAFLPGMLEKMGRQGSAGSILNMASMASSGVTISIWKGFIVCSLSKGRAVDGFAFFNAQGQGRVQKAAPPAGQAHGVRGDLRDHVGLQTHILQAARVGVAPEPGLQGRHGPLAGAGSVRHLPQG